MAGDAPAKKSGGMGKPDLATIGGLVLALAGIVGGLILEGGSVQDVAQVTAAMIVLGGTIGAVMVTTPLSVLIGATKRFAVVFFDKAHSADDLIEEIIGYATKARKSSIVSLEDDLEGIHDPFLKKALSLAVDGMELQQLRQVMELQLVQDEKRGEAEAKVFEAAGGYAPTVGIIGAVMGLIQVMKHLENIEEVGKGIAVAFVATVYGVGIANLLFLPAASKIKARAHHNVESRELMLEGVCSIVEGLNPKLIRSKLEAFTDPDGAAKKAAKQAKAAVGEAASA
jgi:chemotaxis protein MotA